MYCSAVEGTLRDGQRGRCRGQGGSRKLLGRPAELVSRRRLDGGSCARDEWASIRQCSGLAGSGGGMRELALKRRKIVVFHSALGLRPGLLQWVDRLRAAWP